MTFIGIPDEKVCWSRCCISQKAQRQRMRSHILNKHSIWWHMCGMQKIARTLTSDIAWEHLGLGRDITRAITTVEGQWSVSGWLRSDCSLLWDSSSMWTEFSEPGALSCQLIRMVALALSWKHSSDYSAAYWACRCWKSWIFDSASKEASSTVYDLVCVITSTRKSIISLVGTVKLLTYALSFPGIFPSTMEELYKPLNLAHFQPAVLFCTWVEGMMDFP